MRDKSHDTTEIAWEPFINESCQLMLSRDILCHINALHEKSNLNSLDQQSATSEPGK